MKLGKQKISEYQTKTTAGTGPVVYTRLEKKSGALYNTNNKGAQHINTRAMIPVASLQQPVPYIQCQRRASPNDQETILSLILFFIFSLVFLFISTHRQCTGKSNKKDEKRSKASAQAAAAAGVANVLCYAAIKRADGLTYAGEHVERIS